MVILPYEAKTVMIEQQYQCSTA